MARIIPFRGDEHREAQLLLPWYAKGRLDPADCARVEAHLAECAECTDELRLEQELGSEIASLPIEADHGWMRLRDRMAARGVGRRGGRPRSRPVPRRRARLLAWSAVASALILAGVLADASFRSLETPSYQTLGARKVHEAGSLVVIFRPDAREEDLRRVMAKAHVRFVDGPTTAGAYVLRAMQSEPAAALAALKDQPEVVLVQPVDAGSQAP